MKNALLDGVLPAILSGGNYARGRLKTLLSNPREFLGQMSQDLQTAQDQDTASFYQGGMMSPNDPRYAQMSSSDPAWLEQQARLSDDRNIDIAGMGATTGGKVIKNALVKSRKPSRKAITDVDFRSMSPEEALAAAKQGRHLQRVSTTGKIVGSPELTSSAQLGGMRRVMDDNVRKAMDIDPKSALWYHRARDGNIEAAGPVPARQSLLAREEALWSAQADPDTNLGFSLGAHNAYEMGAPLQQARTRAQAEKYIKARDSGAKIPLGKKTGVYGNHLDPTVEQAPHVGTNDIWRGRDMGYTDPATGAPWSGGFSPQQHTFMDGETVLQVDRAKSKQLGGLENWDAGMVQAAPWVYKKGESLHKKFPKRYPTIEDGVRAASQTYVDSFPKYTFSATHEAIPGKGTNHLRGITDMPFDQRNAYSNAAGTRWIDDDGRDVLYDSLGFYQRPAINSTGMYKNSFGDYEVNPMTISRPLGSFKPDAEMGKVMGDATREGIDFTEHFRGFADAQEASAAHKIMLDNTRKAGTKTSLLAKTGGQLSPSEMSAARQIAEDYGLDLTASDGGVAFLNLGSKKIPNSMKAAKAVPQVRNSLAAALGRDVDVTRGGLENIYRPVHGAFDAKDNLVPYAPGTGAATDDLIAHAQRLPESVIAKFDAPAIKARLLAKIENDALMGAKSGLPLREDIQRARALMAAPGGWLKNLIAARQRGEALPAVLAAPLAELLSDDGQLQ